MPTCWENEQELLPQRHCSSRRQFLLQGCCEGAKETRARRSSLGREGGGQESVPSWGRMLGGFPRDSLNLLCLWSSICSIVPQSLCFSCLHGNSSVSLNNGVGLGLSSPSKAPKAQPSTQPSQVPALPQNKQPPDAAVCLPRAPGKCLKNYFCASLGISINPQT